MSYSERNITAQSNHRHGEDSYWEQGPGHFEPEKQHGRVRSCLGRMGWAHLWFCFWSLGSIALLICVLIGCSSPPNQKYALLRMPPDGDVTNPDLFIGLSGMCVAIKNDTTCWRKFPYQFNQKIVNGVLTTIQPNEYITPISKTQGEPVPQLAVALAALLLFSIFLSTVSIAVSVSQESGFSKHVMVTALPDLLVMIACAVIVGMLVYGYPTVWAAPRFYTGAYMMYAALGARVMSHPTVTQAFVKLLSAPIKACCRSENNTAVS